MPGDGARDHPPLDAWEPAAVGEVARIFAGCRAPWWIAGGHAIELAVGRRVRAHADIDVLLLRRDQHELHRVLEGWHLWAADPPGTLRPWSGGEELPHEVHDIWCQPPGSSSWRLQIMLDHVDGDRWVSRRNPAVTLPVPMLGARTAAGVPYLRPEVQLFYKAKGRRPKDEVDLTAVLPVLGAGQRAWLAGTIARTHGPRHPWLGRLRPSSPGSGPPGGPSAPSGEPAPPPA